MRLDKLVAPAYITGAYLIAVPLTEASLTLFPATPSQMMWRFSAVGIMSSSLLTPLLGLLIIAAVATAMEHRAVLRLVSGLGFCITLVLVAALLFFATDAGDAAGTMEGNRNYFLIATGQAAIKVVLMAILSGWLGYSALGIARGLGGKGATKDKAANKVLRAGTN